MDACKKRLSVMKITLTKPLQVSSIAVEIHNTKGPHPGTFLFF